MGSQFVSTMNSSNLLARLHKANFAQKKFEESMILAMVENYPLLRNISLHKGPHSIHKNAKIFLKKICSENCTCTCETVEIIASVVKKICSVY